LERGSRFSSSGTIPAAFTASRSFAMTRNYILDFRVWEHLRRERA
jgi:hypothetical protein